MSTNLNLSIDEFKNYLKSGVMPDDPAPIKNKMVILNVNPIGKPRMVRSDKWKKRTATDKYWNFKDELLRELNRLNLNLGSTNVFNLCFVIQMPDSWSEKRKALMDEKPHQVKPDLDNICKAVFDSISKKDQTIFKLTCEKRWGYKGQIIILT